MSDTGALDPARRLANVALDAKHIISRLTITAEIRYRGAKYTIYAEPINTLQKKIVAGFIQGWSAEIKRGSGSVRFIGESLDSVIMQAGDWITSLPDETVRFDALWQWIGFVLVSLAWLVVCGALLFGYAGLVSFFASMFHP